MSATNAKIRDREYPLHVIHKMVDILEINRIPTNGRTRVIKIMGITLEQKKMIYFLGENRLKIKELSPEEKTAISEKNQQLELKYNLGKNEIHVNGAIIPLVNIIDMSWLPLKDIERFYVKKKKVVLNPGQYTETTKTLFYHYGGDYLTYCGLDIQEFEECWRVLCKAARIKTCYLLWEEWEGEEKSIYSKIQS